jgi:hypothetical protein
MGAIVDTPAFLTNSILLILTSAATCYYSFAVVLLTKGAASPSAIASTKNWQQSQKTNK